MDIGHHHPFLGLQISAAFSYLGTPRPGRFPHSGRRLFLLLRCAASLTVVAVGTCPAVNVIFVIAPEELVDWSLIF